MTHDDAPADREILSWAGFGDATRALSLDVERTGADVLVRARLREW